MKILTPIFAGLLLASCTANTPSSEQSASADLASVKMNENDGCLSGPQEQFGRYLGDWNIQDWQLSREDGKTWNEGKGARWNFVCVGNGIAVQDFWMPNAGGVGTNLRMYDPNSKSWDIAWTASNLPGFTHINAREDDNGNIVMHYVDPPQNPRRRITFYPPTQEGWNWTMETEFGSNKTWVVVYKIKATRR